MTKLNWKQQPTGRYRALASRAVHGVYWIDYTETMHGNLNTGKGFWIRSYGVETSVGGGRSNVSRVPHRTLADAKAVAEFDHEKKCELLRQYGDWRSIPNEAWRQLSDETLAFEEQLSASMTAEIKEKWRRLDAGWQGEPGTLSYDPM